MRVRGTTITIALSALVLTSASIAEAAGRKRAPARNADLTQANVKVDTKRDFNLGPTGARGWMFAKMSSGETVGSNTSAARQVLITSIEKGSPADGVLRFGDVILGVDGKLFNEDARKCLGRAITTAEEKEHKGN